MADSNNDLNIQQSPTTQNMVMANQGQMAFDPKSQVQQLLAQFWSNQVAAIQTDEIDFKTHQLPLARIKKVMKTDDDVRSKMMISAEVPIMFSKACEIFVLELTMRAWIHTEENKRRTLQKSDIAAAISKTDVFDFLIDIVPRETSSKKLDDMRHGMPDYQQFYGGMMPYNADQNLAYQQQMAQLQYMRLMQGQSMEGQVPLTQEQLQQLEQQQQQQQVAAQQNFES